MTSRFLFRVLRLPAGRLPCLFAAALAMFLWAGPARAGLYEDLGGREGLVRITERLFVHALSDPRIRHTWEDTNMDRLKVLVVDQLCQLTGGPCVYKGRDMRSSHTEFKLRSRDFAAFVEDLQAALDECGIPFRTQNRLLALLAPMHRDIVTR